MFATVKLNFENDISYDARCKKWQNNGVMAKINSNSI